MPITRRPAAYDTRWIVVVVSLGILVRVGAAIMLGNGFYFVDEAIYLDAARGLLAGAGFAPDYANVPAYPVIVSAFAAPWPGTIVFVRCAQAVLAGAGALLVIDLGRRTVGASAGIAAGALYALDPLLVVTAGLLYPETVAALLLTAMLLATWIAARTDRIAASAAAGALLAVVILCRLVAAVLVPVVALWVFAVVAAPLARRVLHVVAFGACCMLVVAPWALRNFQLHGHMVPAQTPGLQGAPVARTEIARDGLATALVGRIARDSLALARHVAVEFPHFWELYPTRLATDDPEQVAELHRSDPRLPVQPTSDSTVRNVVSALSFGSELLLALLGLTVAWRRHRAIAVLVLGVMLSYALGFALFYAKLRYRITVMPCLLVLAGVGVTMLADLAFRPLLAATESNRSATTSVAGTRRARG